MGVDIFNDKYWHDLRSRTSVRGVGHNQCYEWCYGTLDLLLKENGIVRFEMKDALRDIEFARKGLWWLPGWIETETPQGIFVADGTAGQIDKTYVDGFYGLLYQAPHELKKLYEIGIPTC